MKMRKAFFICVMFVLSLTLPLSMSFADLKEPLRQTTLKIGHISTNETWSGEIYLNNVVIDKDVTVIVEKGATITCAISAFLYVDGKFIVNGTEENPVNMIPENSIWKWDGIVVNTTGSLVMDNFSIKDGVNPYYKSIIKILGKLCSLTNGTLDSNYVGLSLTSEGGHRIGPLTFNNCDEGLRIYSNDVRSNFKDLTFRGCKMSIGIIYSKNITFSGLDIVGTSSLMGIQWSSNIDIEHVYSEFIPYIDNHTTIYKGSGIFMSGMVSNIMLNDIELKNMSSGLSIKDGDITDVIITDMDLKVDTSVAFKAEVGNLYPNNFELDFINCSLITSGPLCYINDPDINDNFSNNFDVDLVNCTYNTKANINPVGSGYINTSYFMDIFIKDTTGSPLPSILILNGTVLDDKRKVNLEDGEAFKILMQSNCITPNSRVLQNYLLTIIPNDYPSDITILQDQTFSMYRVIEENINLNPVSTFPNTVIMNEDIPFFIYLNGTFIDPDGVALKYVIEPGPNLSVIMVYDLTWAGITIGTVRSDWSGTSWLIVCARDQGGKERSVNSSVIVSPIYDPPRAVSAILDYEIHEDEHLTVDLSGRAISVDGGDIIWSCQDGRYYSCTWNGTMTNLTIIPASDWNGFLSIPITFSDGIGSGSIFLNITVLPVNDPPQDPMSIFHDPLDVTVGDNVTFYTGPGKDIDSASLRYLWDFGDGRSKEGIEVFHVFSKSGTYIISLRLSDGELYSGWVNISLIVENRYIKNDTVEIFDIKIKEMNHDLVFEVKATKGCILYLVLEYENGSLRSYLMKEVTDGNYTVIVPNGDVNGAVSYWISIRDSGVAIDNKKRTDIPDINKENLNDHGTNWPIVVILVMIVLVLILISIFISYILIKRRNKRMSEIGDKGPQSIRIYDEEFLTSPLNIPNTVQEPPSVVTSPSLNEGYLEMKWPSRSSDSPIQNPINIQDQAGPILKPELELLMDELLNQVLEKDIEKSDVGIKDELLKRLNVFRNDGNISEEEYLKIKKDLEEGFGTE